MPLRVFKPSLLSIVALTLAWQVGSVQAMGLLEAYEAALMNDPTFRSAIHENEAGQQSIALGRSGLLPTLSISHLQSWSRGSQSTGNAPTSSLNFDSQVTTLTLRQPLFNMEAVAGYDQGYARANSSEAKLISQSHQLIVRLVEAYANTLLAQDRLNLAKAEHNALEELKHVNENMLRRGEGTQTDLIETKSRHALSQARMIEAQDELEVARLALEAIIGKQAAQLDSLAGDFKVQPIYPADFESWREIAMERNAELVSQRHLVTSNQLEVKKSRAGHAPRVDLVASLNRQNSASFLFPNRDAEFGTVGVEVNLPLYAGGRVVATTNQAQANKARAEADLDALSDRVLVELRRQYQLLQSSIRRIESLDLAVDSALLLVQATEKSIKGGIRINLDLLNAQSQLFSAQIDLAEARYNYLLAYLRLRLAAGTLVLEDIEKIATYFVAKN
ncbi:TolC family outer membrane protein [Nitrosomonas communis]|uniref:Outer membrane protein, protease secretion system n=2 Tax=Nitrosomonas communis TaxID=44574 RepID=A0A1H2V8P4_9PROT|nr:TolC family outer membrane protein [Nitrosomonas communis]SDW64692.1 outer membrane protein, protease secretion system [Nitrosomonas communis]